MMFSQDKIILFLPFSVRNMIDALKYILTVGEYNLAYSKYLCMLNDNSIGNSNEWEKFVSATLKLFGFPEASIKSLKVSF